MNPIPLALAILPLIPGLITGVTDIINAVRNDPATPEAAKAGLDDLIARLNATALAVASLEILNPDTMEDGL